MSFSFIPYTYFKNPYSKESLFLNLGKPPYLLINLSYDFNFLCKYIFLSYTKLTKSLPYVFLLLYGKLIHSANPKSWPVGIIVFVHVVRPYVRHSPLFKSRKTKQQKKIFATVVTMGLAEWIIDDTCLVILFWLVIIYLLSLLSLDALCSFCFQHSQCINQSDWCFAIV